MRRSFNKDICVSTPPPKRRGLYKTKQKRCNELEILLQDYRDQAGERFNFKELAYRCGVQDNTVYRWFYGYCPHHLSWWTIARYIAECTPHSKELIYGDIKDTIEEWRIGE